MASEDASRQVRYLLSSGQVDSSWHASDERIFQAALELFAERGFHGTTTRAIAAQAKLSAGALYTHYTSKEAILYRIIRMTHERMLRDLQLASVSDSEAGARLRALIQCHVRFHAETYIAARIANYELHCLAPEHRRDIVQLRELIELAFKDSLKLAHAYDVVHIDDLDTAATLILSLGIDVSRWYRPGKPPGPQYLAEYYADHLMKMLT